MEVMRQEERLEEGEGGEEEEEEERGVQRFVTEGRLGDE